MPLWGAACGKYTPNKYVPRRCIIMFDIFGHRSGVFPWRRVCNRAAVVDGGDGRVSPHSRLRRQCGVIEVVTAPRLSSAMAEATHTDAAVAVAKFASCADAFEVAAYWQP